MKTTILILAILFTVPSVYTASAVTYYGNDNYSRSVRSNCEYQTSTRTRVSRIINSQAAQQCFNNTVQNDRRNRMDDSYSAANEAYTDYMKEATKNLRYNRRNR